MSYSGGSNSYSYSSDGNGNYADTDTYVNGDYARSESHAYVNGHDLYIEKHTDLKYGGSKTTTYDRTSGTTTETSEGYSGK